MKEDRVLMWTNVIDINRFLFLWSFSWYNHAEKRQPKEEESNINKPPSKTLNKKKINSCFYLIYIHINLKPKLRKF